MREIEKKFHISQAEIPFLIKYLESDDFIYEPSLKQTDIYLTPPDKNIYKEDRALRIRFEEKGGQEMAHITYKGKNASAEFHDRIEIDSKVENGSAVLEIFTNLGFLEFFRISKTREQYTKGKYVVAIDSVDDLGYFVEVETQSEETTAEIYNGIDSFVKAIGLKTIKEEAKNYLLLLYEKKHS